MNFTLNTAFLFTLFVLVHLGISRMTGATGFMKKIILVFLPFFIAPFFVDKVCPSFFHALAVDPSLRWICSAVLVSLFNVYMIALVCTRNSVSLRIMDEMVTANRGMNLDDLEKVYSERESVSSRLELMEGNGYLRRGPGEMIEITEKARKIARITIGFRKALGIVNPG